MDSIFHRRSVRRFTAEPVTEQEISQILKAAMAAPTACNDRQYQFYVVTNEAVKKQLSACSPYAGCAAGAPVVIVPCFEEGKGSAPEYAEINMAIVCENLMLEADSLGLGSVFLGIDPESDRMDKVREVLGLPAGLQPFAIIPVGHPAAAPKPVDRFDPDRIHYIR